MLLLRRDMKYGRLLRIYLQKESKMSNALNELYEYCTESRDPAGALMLTGEWGCGKTYLVTQILKNKLGDTYSLLHVSLFGLSSVEEIDTKIKQAWLTSYIKIKAPKEVGVNEDKIRICKAVLKKIKEESLFPKSVNRVVSLSVDAMEILEIKPVIKSWKVILIFDDLERSGVSSNDLLGCINNYCENLHFHTIIIANEDKIEKNLGYQEIKEKLVQRTIYYQADIGSTIDSIIEYSGSIQSGYKTFLQKHKGDIKILFMEDKRTTDERRVHRPQNLRVLKFALYDFERIYDILISKRVQAIENWLYAYVVYTLCFHAQIISKNDLQKATELKKMYPGFYSDDYITTKIKCWIEDGKWEKTCINREIESYIKRSKAKTSDEKVRTFRLGMLDEEDVLNGFPKVVNMAYEGELELNEYVNFIMNCKEARRFGFDRLESFCIEWGKIYKGIQKSIQRMEEMLVSTNENLGPVQYTLDIDHGYNENEKLAYEIIKDAYNNEKLMYKKNKRRYCDQLKGENPVATVRNAQGLRLDHFDVDMAEITAQIYKKLNNADKEEFVQMHASTWNMYIAISDYKATSQAEGFTHLKKQLVTYRDELEKLQNQRIATKYTEQFIKDTTQQIKSEKEKAKKLEISEKRNEISM